jgi:hypothetical protein
MNFKDYENTMAPPPRPSKPKLPAAPKGMESKPELLREYACILDNYEAELELFQKQMETYQKQLEEYYMDGAKVREKFKCDVLHELGLTEHPKADEAYKVACELAYEFAYDGPDVDDFQSVYIVLKSLAKLLL